MEEVYSKLISGGQMQPQVGIWKRFIRSLSEVDRCSLRCGSGRGLLEVYLGWIDASSDGDLEEVYYITAISGAHSIRRSIKCVTRTLWGETNTKTASSP